ncbi:ribosomal protein S18-alanine N-acetyltransferase [Cytobacillus sp. FSL W7-1323]|uniref:[Ribosomal protein bS18]-alanine N-acetyltransferase n=1 Tax=Cytobacillus kochii TaxID=859143 RepID=A0A248TGB4_9BACI|nr:MULTISPECIES: ribosomal protein S18-alanine N-acetyltransferase [Cytobacillus]ASV67236.1 ribosomal-protein-alanine N-acetyltransferase [Cytobacillus kochii]MDQ0187776.1 ribosomal-protein-alanine N-acetyltransferase [Cytobacillus kochii]MEA1855636.1 ribosomal protein S18-alanine N-acetyltransferase [Cytobacillus sp. OWB-43]
MTSKLTFRLMNEDDIDEVLKVEQASFSSPWSREAFYNEMTLNQFSVYVVLEDGEELIGYGGAWVVTDEAHVTNVAILPRYRGKKLGEALMVQLMDVVKEMGALKMTLEVRVSNMIARRLYSKLGFQEGGIRKNYYSDNHEDALVMWVNIK